MKETTIQYIYGMKYRGFAPMCQPMDGLIMWSDSPEDWVDDPQRYYCVLFYNHRLSDKEVSDYELEFVKSFES